MGRLVLLAHAETAATRAASFPADEGLTPRGRDRAERLRHDLPHAAKVWRSPALAAAETADALGWQAAVVAPALADLDHGRWRGRPITDVAAAEPHGLAAWRADPAFAEHGGESLAAMLARVGTWLSERVDAGGCELAITHAAVVRCAVLFALDAGARSFWLVDAAPLTRVELSSDGRRWSLRQIVSA